MLRYDSFSTGKKNNLQLWSIFRGFLVEFREEWIGFRAKVGEKRNEWV